MFLLCHCVKTHFLTEQTLDFNQITPQTQRPGGSVPSLGFNGIHCPCVASNKQACGRGPCGQSTSLIDALHPACKKKKKKLCVRFECWPRSQRGSTVRPSWQSLMEMIRGCEITGLRRTALIVDWPLSVRL